MLNEEQIKSAQEKIDLEELDLWSDLNKKIHVLIDAIALKDQVTAESIKRSIVMKLIIEKKLRPSLKDLDTTTQEEVIERLEKILHAN